MLDLRELAAQAVEGRDRCKVARLLDELEGDNRAWLAEALAGGLEATTIALALTRGGMPVSDSTVGRHRRRMCTCFAGGA